MKVIVNSTAVITRTIPARNGNAAMYFREQKAAVERPGDFPLPFPLGLDDDQQPYPEGIYEISADSIQLNKFGGLEFARRIRLTNHKPHSPAPKG